MRIRFSALLTAMLLWLSGGVAQEAARTAEIFDRSGDAGQLTIRFLWLGEQVADDKPGDCMILTSPDGQVMVLDCGHLLASQYVIDALEKGWVYGWKKRGWVKSDKKPALNADLWEQMLAQVARHDVRYHWVKGHASNEKNNRCDELAVMESRKFKK